MECLFAHVSAFRYVVLNIINALVLVFINMFKTITHVTFQIVDVNLFRLLDVFKDSLAPFAHNPSFLPRFNEIKHISHEINQSSNSF